MIQNNLGTNYIHIEFGIAWDSLKISFRYLTNTKKWKVYANPVQHCQYGQADNPSDPANRIRHGAVFLNTFAAIESLFFPRISFTGFSKENNKTKTKH